MADAAGRSRVVRIVAGRPVYFDDEGFFWDPDDWSEEAALELARDRGMDGLDEAQWRVIRFMRGWYNHHGRTPMNKDLKAGTGMTLLELEHLFPKGIKMGARVLAGLPNPRTCLD
jgi:TusE/DsrC/DsvC family sulfur relay protein